MADRPTPLDASDGGGGGSGGGGGGVPCRRLRRLVPASPRRRRAMHGVRRLVGVPHGPSVRRRHARVLAGRGRGCAAAVVEELAVPRLVRSLPRRRRRLPRVRRALERARWPYLQDGLAWRVAAGSELNAMRQLRRSLCGEFAQQEGRLSWVVGSVITEKSRGYHVRGGTGVISERRDCVLPSVNSHFAPANLNPGATSSVSI